MQSMKAKHACGVDIGGTHVTAALIDLSSNAIIRETVRRAKVDASGSAEEIVRNWTAVIGEALAVVNEETVNIGIAMPGPFDYEEGISYIKRQHKYDALYNINVKNLLAKHLAQPVNTITFANDAACFLQGEVAAGIAKGYENVAGFTLGTGLGSAFFSNGIAEDADLWKAPFLSGAAEDYLSSRWLVKRYKTASGKKITGVQELAEIVDEDKEVRNIFEEFGLNLGAFIRKTISGREIEMVVLGGNIAQALPLFRNGVYQNLADVIPLPVIQNSVLGEHAALIGAVSINTLITTL